MINGGEGWDDYIDRIGLFFFFVACAGISLIVLAFNWVCWLNQCCCCDFLHNPVNKRIAWWMSFSSLCGMLACCISGCVSVNRFGFAIEGAWCAFDRVYYDSLNGQLKTTEPKWKGFENAETLLTNFDSFVSNVKNININLINEKCENINNIDYILEKINNSLIQLNNLVSFDVNGIKNYFRNGNRTEFKKIKDNLLEDNCFYYGRILIGCMKVLAMVYFCLFIITITLAGVSMMFYACLKRQGYLITFMHVLWNIIRFFMFSFFIFGAAYGIFFLALRDSIAVVQGLFKYEFLDKPSKNLFPNKENNQFLIKCLNQSDYNFINDVDMQNKIALEDFFLSYLNLKNQSGTGKCVDGIKNHLNGQDFHFNDLVEFASQKGGLYGSLNCGFLQTDLNLIYRALYDASVESRILAACSLCASFFGAVAVYFYLLVLHHYNNEIFFDSGKSIFTGFDGFGRGYKTKSHNKDPAYKKRKLRAEIELTSRNDEGSNYKDINKNNDEDE